MKYWRFLLLFVFPCTWLYNAGCAGSEASVTRQIKTLLKERYAEDFEIVSFHETYITQPKYSVVAYPVKHPGWLFRASLSKKNDHDLEDDYVYKKHIHQATEALEAFAKSLPVKLRGCVVPHFAIADSIIHHHTLDYDELTAFQQPGDRLDIEAYIFAAFGDSLSADIYAAVRKLAAHYHEQKFNAVNMQLRFFQLETLHGQNPDTMTFCMTGLRADNGGYCFDTYHFGDARFRMFLDSVETKSALTDDQLRRETLPVHP